mmetsp:Transcript_22455/g.57369  ORF Transcript_22455/g.57369 Transcript_22455/m.57369 type:complete len:82 (+) Transcript_22455:1422-1667(+)
MGTPLNMMLGFPSTLGANNNNCRILTAPQMPIPTTLQRLAPHLAAPLPCNRQHGIADNKSKRPESRKAIDESINASDTSST